MAEEAFRIYDCCEHCEHGINDPPHLERCPEGCADEGDESRNWPCCGHCDHDPGQLHAGPCITCDFDFIDYGRR